MAEEAGNDRGGAGHDDGLLQPGDVRRRIRAWWEDFLSSFHPGQWGRAEQGGFRQSREYWSKTLSLALSLFVVAFALKLVMDWADPFGLLSASKRQSETLSSQLAAPLYHSAAQDHIAVVLIDKDTLEARDMAWPPRYVYYEEVLRRILRERPRAVYVDLLVNRNRVFDDSLPEAKETLAADLEAYPAPVFFGTDTPGAPTLFSEVPGVGTAVTAWEKVDYPLTLSPAQAVGASMGADEACVANDESRSVALALYQAACPRAGMAGCAEHAALMSREQACRPIAVQWGQRPPVGSARAVALDKAGCVVDSGSPFRKLSKMGAWLYGGLFGNIWPKLHQTAWEPCSYTLTVHEEQLDDLEIRAQLRDRVVLVGADLVGLNDLASNPVNGQIPGVYVHAMALDNLMTWGRDHLSPLPRAGWASLALALLTSFVVAVVLRHTRWVGAWLVLAGVVLAFGPIAVMHFWLHHPPVDWIGSLLMFAWVVFMARRVAQRVPRSPTDTPTIAPAAAPAAATSGD